ncbi:helix-turn-helix transcriptional regulator [Paenibacillus sp. 11B]|uniref:helix-turn-helix domain-containing protein n=1 Tax=Paenibacillus sp. 11B TaxID=3060965 RepID=UPI00264DA816|nr:helix-turn-helix transcriptional regulator [Paenibacillus sp. 11B]MDN8591919.1 helix-turn-helix transcriptional regulator [Paenibacillus sp. 11B]
MYKKFEKLLIAAEKTAYQVSKDTGISTATLSSWKNGNYNPKIDKILILAAYFGVTVDYFLSEDAEVENSKSGPLGHNHPEFLNSLEVPFNERV